jgi:hypothetical protein
MRVPDGYPYRRKTWLKLLDPNNPYTAQRRAQMGWVPESHIPILDAMRELGQHDIEGWTGNEQTARGFLKAPDPPWYWRSYDDRQQEYFTISDDNIVTHCSEEEAQKWWLSIEPVLVAEWQQETADCGRWELCLNKMRNRLALGTTPSFALTDSGEFQKIPVQGWVGAKGEYFLRGGSIQFSIPGIVSSYHVKGLIVVPKDFLRKVEAEREVQEPKPANQPALQLDRYPYLEFMLQAVTSGVVPTTQRVPKKTIEDWLRRNWPPKLGRPTDTKITNIATLLRRPEDEKGGNLP